MRILVLTNMYPPHHYGGYELSCRDVVERWRAKGHSVTVLTTTLRLPGRAPETPGVRRELHFWWDDHVLLSPWAGRRLAWEWHNHRALDRALDDVQPDVVSVWNMGAMSLSLLATIARRRIPRVFVVCDDWLVYGPKLDAWTRVWQHRRRAGRLVSAVTGIPTDPGRLDDGAFCFVSETTRSRASSVGTFPISGVVYSGIDPTDFPLSEHRPRPWRGSLLYVGRIDERKGLRTLFDALQLLPSCHLRVLGGGDPAFRAALMAQAPARRVSWGTVPRSELAAEYRAADAVVFPSEWSEPFGLVPVEAMACATPVVATGAGGSGEFLRDGVNALLYPPGDGSALAAAVERLASSPELRQRIAEGGLALAARLTVDALADELEAWHAGAVSGFSQGLPPSRELPVA